MNATLSETYFLAARARSKLTREAARHDHDLRILVSHANLLDSLMDSLAKQRAEQRAEQKLNQASSIASKVSFAAPPHKLHASVPGVAVIPEEEEDDYDEEEDPEYEQDSSDSDSDDYEDEEDDDDDLKFYGITYLHENKSSPVVGFKTLPKREQFAVTEDEVDENEEEDDNNMTSPTDSLPQLSYSSGEESDEEEATEVAPPVVTLDRKQRMIVREIQVAA